MKKKRLGTSVVDLEKPKLVYIYVCVWNCCIRWIGLPYERENTTRGTSQSRHRQSIGNVLWNVLFSLLFSSSSVDLDPSPSSPNVIQQCVKDSVASQEAKWNFDEELRVCVYVCMYVCDRYRSIDRFIYIDRSILENVEKKFNFFVFGAVKI